MNNVSGVRSAIRPRTVLLAQDDATLRTALAELLEDNGFEVMTAATLERARYIVFESRHPVGIVVLGLTFPDGDGESLAAAMCANPDKATPLVFMSASNRRALADRYAVSFLPLPVDLDVALATITVAFERDVRPAVRVG